MSRSLLIIFIILGTLTNSEKYCFDDREFCETNIPYVRYTLNDEILDNYLRDVKNKVDSKIISFNDARDFCEDFVGTELAVISNEKDQKLARDICSDGELGVNCWIELDSNSDFNAWCNDKTSKGNNDCNFKRQGVLCRNPTYSPNEGCKCECTECYLEIDGSVYNNNISESVYKYITSCNNDKSTISGLPFDVSIKEDKSLVQDLIMTFYDENGIFVSSLYVNGSNAVTNKGNIIGTNNENWLCTDENFRLSNNNKPCKLNTVQIKYGKTLNEHEILILTNNKISNSNYFDARILISDKFGVQNNEIDNPFIDLYVNECLADKTCGICGKHNSEEFNHESLIKIRRLRYLEMPTIPPTVRPTQGPIAPTARTAAPSSNPTGKPVTPPTGP